tara:strand:+ start:5117 stop:5470 length:354 start_codon:yes stop_codon:yes gene_type:complete
MKYFFELHEKDSDKATEILKDQLNKELKINSIKWNYKDSFTVDTKLADLPDLELEIAELFTDCKVEFSVYATCETCEGEGHYEVMNCYNQSNECCGGCLSYEDCKDCDVEGKVLIEF